MKTERMTRILAITLTIAMMMSLMLVFTVAGSAAGSENTYTLNVDELTPFGAGSRYDGEYQKAGTNNYFTLFYTEQTKIELNAKNFSDGLSSTQRISWGAKSEIGDRIHNAVKIQTAGPASVKVWWVCGGEVTGSSAIRQVAIFSADGSVVDTTAVTEVEKTETNTDGVKNDPFVSTLEIPAAGTYYIGNTGGSNYFHKIEVVDSPSSGVPAERADWSTVSAPVITSASDDGNGNIVVKVDALVGLDGADELLVTMSNEAGESIITKGSITEKASHTLTFSPIASGNYSFKAELIRQGEDSKTCDSVVAGFVYVLGTPNLKSVTSIGGGAIEIKWGDIHEAEAYAIYQDGVKIDTVDAATLSYVAKGLSIGQEYSFQVSVIRGSEENKSTALSAVATAEANRAWGFTAYGESATESKNSYTGSINDDGYVTISSQGNGGKIKPDGADGLAFYYTAIPSEYNFKLRARVHVDTWTFSNGQEGFGLLVTDRLGEHGNTATFWNNSYLAGSTKIEYKYDGDNDAIIDIKVVNSAYKKFSMKIGIGTVVRTGVTKDNLALFEAEDNSQAIREFFYARNYTLDRTAADVCNQSGTYNIIGNYTDTFSGCLEERFLITEYIMEIERNNSGYFINYYDKDGNFISQKKYYDPDALCMIDEDYIYAGFFASRNVTATFSGVELTTILKSEDDRPIEYPEISYVTPTVNVNSGNVTTNGTYELMVDVNVAGFLTVIYNDETIVSEKRVAAESRFRTDIKLANYYENPIKIEFTPDPYQDLPEFTELSNTKTIYKTHDLMYNPGNFHRKTIYVSPDVLPHTTTANGTKENPFDIFTALENAYPGQTLILMEGTYKPGSALTVQRSMDGKEGAMIRLIADPEAKTRPVIDFEGLYSGFTLAGDYWYLRGFDVTGSMDMQKGLLVAGSHNILDQINTYYNGNTGIQLSRMSGSDLYEDWPSYNLILNCTSYCNFDSGYEDADGFAAKLTVGDGNVFDGCISYNNADDGWDLYAKAETGPIGAVTIRNCIAYNNGTVPGSTKHGNGNGFKLGGESISGHHVIENSIAFNNWQKGIDCNSCPDITVTNCISFNNGGYNVALYTNNVNNTAFVANGVISFRTENLAQSENLKGRGSQIVENYINDSTYYWNEAAGYCANPSGVQITADMFVSLEFNGWTRNADGTINLGGFLEIKNNVPANAAGCKLGGQASEEIVLLEDAKCTYNKAWYKLDMTGHYHVCMLCGNKTDIGEHDLVWIIDKEVFGNNPGAKHQECTICGHKRATITVYPDAPVVPDIPDQPETPDTPDVPETPDTPNEPETPVELNFFQKIWLAILNFFKKLFGMA